MTKPTYFRTMDFISDQVIADFQTLADHYGISRAELTRLVIMHTLKANKDDLKMCPTFLPKWLTDAQVLLMEAQR